MEQNQNIDMCFIKRILVIDNDEEWPRIVTNQWKKISDKIQVESLIIKEDNEIEQLEVNKINNCDLIFLDLYLTERHHSEISDDKISGVRVLKRINEYQNQYIYIPPVIVLSGSYNLDRALRIKNSYNAFDYLYKPELNNLEKIIREKNWDKILAEDLGLASWIKNNELKSNVMLVKRLIERQPDRFWFGNKIYAIVDHAQKHALGVWRNLYYWLKDSPIINKLGDEELYILLMSAFLHDIGLSGNEEYSLPTDVRAIHGVISDMLLNNYEYGPAQYLGIKKDKNYFTSNNNQGEYEYTLEFKKLVKAIGLICKYHDGRVPITKEQHVNMYFGRIEWDREMFSTYYNSKSFEEECKSKLKEENWNMNLLLALLMFADAAHIDRERVGEYPVKDARLKVVERDGKFWFKKIVARLNLLEHQAANTQGVGTTNLQTLKEKRKDLFNKNNKQVEETYDNWRLKSDAEARQFYKEIQSLIPLYDIDFLKQLEFISFIKRQDNHYDKHFSVHYFDPNDITKRSIIFFSGTCEDKDNLTFTFIAQNNQPMFSVKYLLNENDIKKYNIDIERVLNDILKDLEYEWLRIYPIITAAWTDCDKNIVYKDIKSNIVVIKNKIRGGCSS